MSLRGTPAAPTGSVQVRGRAEPVALAGQEIIASIDAALTPTPSGGLTLTPKVTVGAASVDGDLATVGGKVTLGRLFRKGRLDRDGAIGDAKLAVRVDVPKRSMSSLAPLRPKLANIPGDVFLSVKATGSPKEPELEIAGEWSGYETATGAAGKVVLGAAGTPKAMTASVGLGASGQAKLSIIAARENEAIRIGARVDAEPVKLAELLPKRATELGGLVAEFGDLESKLGAEIVVYKRAEGLELGKVDMNGFLEVRDAKLVVTGSKREIRDIRFRLEGERDVIRLAELSALESDEQESNRKIEIGAEASLAVGRPKTVRGSIKTHKWLVFGGSMGEPDSPHATVDTEIDIVADLSGDTGKGPVIDATINSLEFLDPDRAIRDHGLQYVSAGGDIKFKDETDVEVGKLGPAQSEAATSAEPRKRKPMLIRLHIPKPVHLVKAPIDVELSGDMEVEITEDGIAPKGSFEIHGGEVGLFGHKHRYSGGGIVFDDARPNGELSLEFSNKLPPATLRQLSHASGGREVKIIIGGSASKQEIVLAGAGNAGMLEVMSIHNAGRSYYYTEPDLPASSTVQAPQLLQPMVITYIATNLPHLLVLDRFSAWADPYDGPEAYGRVEHFVGERTSSNHKNRVRIVSRPETVGRSRTEVQLDRMLVNSAQTAFGAGVRAGSRLGGGLALFFEWSSAN